MAVAAALLLGSGWLAVHAGGAAADFLPSLDMRRRPLEDVPPIVSSPPPRRLARRVVLVLIDGLRLDLSYGRPFLDSLRERGVDARVLSHYPTMSRPNHVALLTGVEPRWSGVRTNFFSDRLKMDSLMHRARAAGLRPTFLSNGADGVLGMYADTFYEANYNPYADVMTRAAARAIARGDELLMLWIQDVDDAGHEHGAASQEYREAIRVVDRRLAALLGDLDLAKDAVIVVADHGHIEKGGHGGVEPHVTEVPLIMAGAGVKRGALPLGAQLVDVAPTVAALLGLPSPGHALGRVLIGTLDVSPEEAVALAQADTVRHSRLRPALDATIAHAEDQARDARTERGVIVVIAFLALAVLASFASSRGIILIDRRVLLIAVPSFPAMFYGMIATFESWLSPSMVPAAGDVTSKLFLYGLVAAGVHLVASWIALRHRPIPRERLAAATALSLVGLVVALAPAGAAWAVTSRPTPLILPGPDEVMLPPVTYSAVSCFAGSITLLMAVEYVVFLARASDPLRYKRDARSPSL
jgi:hypothetical protein